MATLQDQGTAYRGEDYVMAFTMTPTTNIAGWTISWRAKNATSDPSALYTVAGVITSAAAGQFSVTLPAATTTALTSDAYQCDVWRTDSGSAALLAMGRLLVKGSVRIP